MKRLFFLLIIFLCAAFALSEDLVFKTLDNGMQVAVKRNTSNNSAAVYGFVKTGAIKEAEYLGCGISHYLEHIVSSGTTTKHSEAEYSELYEKCGLLANAYTTTDMTAYHLSGENTYLDTMITTIAEFLRYCQFDQTEIDREKEVILKEMIMRSTDVYTQIRNWEYAVRYPDTNLTYPIIGYPELFKTLSREDLVRYYNRHYVPNNIIFVVTGNIDPRSTMQKIEAELSDWQRGIYEPVYLPAQNPYGTEFSFTKEFKINNPRVSINYIIPQAYYQYSAELNAALEILFSKRSSPVNYLLVEEEKLVNNVWAYSPLITDQSGMNSVTIGFEPKNENDIDKIIEIIDQQLLKAAKEGFEQTDLDNYINRTKASHILYELTPDREANLIGWSFYNQGDPDILGTQIKALEAIRRDDMPLALENIVLTGQRVITKALPDKETAAEQNSRLADIQADLSMQKVEISPDFSLYYNKTDQPEVVNLALWLPIKQSWEDTDNAGILQMTADLLLKGSRNFNSIFISEWMEDHVVSYDISVDAAGSLVTIKCLTADLSEMLNIFVDGFNHPDFSENEIELWKERKQSSFDRQSSSASYQHRIFRSSVLYGGDTRWGMTTAQVIKNQMSFTKQDIEDCWDSCFKINIFQLAINGDISLEYALELADRLKNKLRQGSVKQPENYLTVPAQSQSYAQQYDFEQVNIDINLPAPATNDADFKVMKVINALLNRTDGGLHEATRGSRDLAYYAYAYFSTTPQYGFLRLSSQTSVNKMDELVQVLKDELDSMKNIQISQEEIQQVISNQHIIRRNNISAAYLPRLVISNETSGLGYDWSQRELEELSSVTTEDIKRVAGRYFDAKVVIISYPSENFQRQIE